MSSKKKNSIKQTDSSTSGDHTIPQLVMSYLQRAAQVTGIQRTNTVWLAKLLIIVTNIIFMILGATAVIIGILYKLGILEMAGTTVQSQTCGFLKTFPSLLVVIGTGLFVLSYAGCYGAYKEDTSLLTVYAFIMALLFFAQTTISIYAMYSSSPFKGLEQEVRNNLLRTYGSYGRDIQSTAFIDALQRNYKCCGMYNPRCMMWQNGTFPTSCCKSQTQDCMKPHQNGCWKDFYDNAVHTIYVISRVLICLSVVEVLELILALVLTITLVIIKRPIVI